MKDRSDAAHVKAAKCVCGHAFSRHTFLPDIAINYGTCMDCEACEGFSVRLAEKRAPDARAALYPDPGHVSTPPTWEDFERLSLHYPAARQALTMWRVDALTKEQALIAACFAFARIFKMQHDAAVSHLQWMTSNDPQEDAQGKLVDAYWQAQDNWSAQCFDYTSMPEAMRRSAHEVARDGFNAIVSTLGPIVRPLLNAEYWQAVRESTKPKQGTRLQALKVLAAAEPDGKVQP